MLHTTRNYPSHGRQTPVMDVLSLERGRVKMGGASDTGVCLGGRPLGTFGVDEIALFILVDDALYG